MLQDVQLLKLKKNDIFYRYVLVYGGEPQRPYYQIYDLYERKQWDPIVSNLNKKWSDDDNIMYSHHSKYFFDQGLAMVTDVFKPNIIHVAGGNETRTKYGYFTMNEDFNSFSQS